MLKQAYKLSWKNLGLILWQKLISQIIKIIQIIIKIKLKLNSLIKLKILTKIKKILLMLWDFLSFFVIVIKVY